jgi:hypothetical protein
VDDHGTPSLFLSSPASTSAEQRVDSSATEREVDSPVASPAASSGRDEDEDGSETYSSSTSNECIPDDCLMLYVGIPLEEIEAQGDNGSRLSLFDKALRVWAVRNSIDPDDHAAVYEKICADFDPVNVFSAETGIDRQTMEAIYDDIERTGDGGININQGKMIAKAELERRAIDDPAFSALNRDPELVEDICKVVQGVHSQVQQVQDQIHETTEAE